MYGVFLGLGNSFGLEIPTGLKADQFGYAAVQVLARSRPHLLRVPSNPDLKLLSDPPFEALLMVDHPLPLPALSPLCLPLWSGALLGGDGLGRPGRRRRDDGQERNNPRPLSPSC